MVLWSPLRCTLTTPDVSTTNAETGQPLARQASIAVVAASTARASGSVYPDCATCATAGEGNTGAAAAAKISIVALTVWILVISHSPDLFESEHVWNQPSEGLDHLGVCYRERQ